MPRRLRILIEGGLYHVYNRFARGEEVFADPEEAVAFVELLREVKGRDELTVYAWCLMSNHYHLAVRTSPVPLSRTMKHLQGTFSRAFNRRWRRTGPLWQSRYQAQLIKDQRYFDQVMVYIHVNPVRAGIVADPVDHAFSGHREIMGKVSKPLIDVDEALAGLGNTVRAARREYLRRIRAALEQERQDEKARRWWHPDPDRDLEPRSVAYVDELGRSTGFERPTLDPAGYLSMASEILGVSEGRLASGRRDRETARFRLLVATVGVERWRQRAGELAASLDKHPVAVSRWVSTGARLRAGDAEFAEDLRHLDEELSRRTIAALAGGRASR